MNITFCARTPSLLGRRVEDAEGMGWGLRARYVRARRRKKEARAWAGC